MQKMHRFILRAKELKNMFENKGMRMIGAPRPSAQLMGMPKFENLGKNNNDFNSKILNTLNEKIIHLCLKYSIDNPYLFESLYNLINLSILAFL